MYRSALKGNWLRKSMAIWEPWLWMIAITDHFMIYGWTLKRQHRLRRSFGPANDYTHFNPHPSLAASLRFPLQNSP